MHPHEELARREIELIQAGDDEGVAALYSSDFIPHYPGRNPLAGTYTDVGQFLDRLDELFVDGTVQRELDDALDTDDHAVQLLRVTAEAKERSHTWNAVTSCTCVMDSSLRRGFISATSTPSTST